jgi:hypothetical protein
VPDTSDDPLAHEVPRPHRGRAGRADGGGEDPRLLPRVGRGQTRGSRADHRQVEEGREFLLVSVSDEKNLAEAERFRAECIQLADPRVCDEACAEAKIAAIKPFYLLQGGLHFERDRPPEMLMELVVPAGASRDAAHPGIRDEADRAREPVAEPDGRDRMVDWFYRHLKGKTDYDNLPPTSPPYWGKYVVPRQQPRRRPAEAGAHRGHAGRLLRRGTRS